MASEEARGPAAAVELARPGHGAEGRIGVEPARQPLHPAGLGSRVGIESADDITGRRVEAARGRPEHTALRLDHDRGAVGGGDLLRVVGRSVVDDDHFVRGSGLRRQIGQASIQHPGVVERGDDDTDGAHHCRA
ncbi:hypothetical protein GCM10017607_30150 [Microbacterium thalassium]|nr:hypothetical protein GCM10017607_30150 [Microbacterium thalassium]